MLFNSIEYLFVFLPATFACYWLVNRFVPKAGKLLLVAASLVFYGWCLPKFLILLAASILIDYFWAQALRKYRNRALLVGGLVLNCAPLVFFKYTDFLLTSAATALGWVGVEWTWQPLKLALPLGISYFTFVQIAYLVDAYRGSPKVSFVDYALHVSFWPKLISGPIVRQREIVPQLTATRFRRMQPLHVYLGIIVFVIGLAKKLLLADPLGAVADWGWKAGALDCASAWLTTVCYTLQLYFDFSGYTDMAWGSAILFNIRLPINFNSPYKADSIQDFWRRWHISLSKWLRDYLYFTFGGSRCSLAKTLRNCFLTFLIGGIWHGAGWTFIIWGAMHGFALSICNLWRKLQPYRLPKPIAWLLTILFVHVAWVFFRAPDAASACVMLKTMAGAATTNATHYDWSWAHAYFTYGVLIVCIFVLPLRHSMQLAFGAARRFGRWRSQLAWGAVCAALFFASMLRLLAKNVEASPFVYFQF